MTGGLIVLFGIIAMVMVHEAGHFIAAKALGMKATEFFFGFGPKLWSRRSRSEVTSASSG
jgi:membrane-associated protease RseP (regulator of RpoE activity)